MQLLSKLAGRAACNASCLLRSKVLSPATASLVSRQYRIQPSHAAPLQSLLRDKLLRTVICTSSVHRHMSDNSRGKPPNKDNDKKQPNDGSDGAGIFMIAIVLAYLTMEIMNAINNDGSQEFEPSREFRNISWNEFVNHMLIKGEVERIHVRMDMDVITVHLYEGAIVNGKKVDNLEYNLNMVGIEKFEEKLREVESTIGMSGSKGVPVEYFRASSSAAVIITKLFVGTLIIAFLVSLRSHMKISSMVDPFFKMKKAKFTHIDPLMPDSGRGVKFADVAGAKEAKLEVMEVVDFLTNSFKYTRLGAKSPKGVLLLGPPGCGKTMLAKAVATEGKLPFLAMNGSEFIEMIGGLGAARVRNLFEEATKRAPCIIYIDEIDAIGRKRSGPGVQGGYSESEHTLNQLLVSMDGIGTSKDVLVMGSTNRLDILDKALLRPGRFDRHILLDLPTLDERQEILESHLKHIVLEHPPEYYSKRLAGLTLGFSGADLANVVNEAALSAARNVRPKVIGDDLQSAIDRVLTGAEKKNTTVSPEERRVIAYHEAGHALIGWMLEHTDALLKVSIVPKTSQILGFAQYHPTDRKLYTQEQLTERLCMTLGGRVAESVVFNKITNGAQNDLQKVTSMAHAMVTQYGFSQAVGHVSFGAIDEDRPTRRYYSDYMTKTIDREVHRIIFEAYKATEAIINKERHKLKLLAEALLEHETLFSEDVQKLWGPPPHGPKTGVDDLEFERENNSWKDPYKKGPSQT